jgi:hypothetical protein
MNRYVAIFAGAALVASGGAAGAQAANAAQRQFAVGAFDRITSAGAPLVLVSVGHGQSVRAEGPAAALDKLEAVVERGSLQIRLKKPYRNNTDWRDLRGVTFRVSVPRLVGSTVAGAGAMRIDKVEGRRFAGIVAGSGDLDIATLRVDDAQFTMAGSGDLHARGSARQASLTVAGSGNIVARDVVTRTASISIAGSGDAQLTAQDSAAISIVGSGNASIAGSARCTVTRMGSGRAHCGA